MKTARFAIRYRIAGKIYRITMPGISACHVCRDWNRPGAELLSVEECDEHGSAL
jgi:hypothetical protein